MKYFLIFALMLSVAAFAGDKKDKAHATTAMSEKGKCELKDGEQHTSIALPTAQFDQCGHSEKTISTALKEVKGVTNTMVDAKSKTAHVHFATADVKVESLEKALSAAGYDANEVKRSETAYAKLPDCCKVTTQ